MSTRRLSTGSSITVVVCALALLLTLPQEKRSWLPGFLGTADFHFGLDLAGGTQLDFRVSEQEMIDQVAALTEEISQARAQGADADSIAVLELQRSSIEEQRTNIVEAIRAVIERRINALGVSEAMITPSYVGGEKHLLVECPGVVDTQECIDTVGKTIKLEFKEELTQATAEFEQEIRGKANTALKRITGSGESLAKVGEDLSDELGVGYTPEGMFFRETLPAGLNDLWTLEPSENVIMRDGIISISGTDQAGNPSTQDVNGVFLAQVVRPRTQTGRTITEGPTAFEHLSKEGSGTSYAAHENRALSDVPAEVTTVIRSMAPGELRIATLANGDTRLLFLRSFTPGKQEMEGSHILIAYRGATSAAETVTRSKEEAKALAESQRERALKGENFAQLAKQNSDGPSRESSGSLGTFSPDMMVPAFSSAAFALENGGISDVVETAFGFHVIRANSAPRQTADRANFNELSVAGEGASGRAQEFLNRLQAGNVQRQEEAIFLRTIFFSLLPTGWKDTPLDGKHFRSATVTLDPVTNIPVVQILFDDEGGRMFQELTARNIGNQIAIFVGGQLVSAPVVQTEIAGGAAIITGIGSFDQAKSLAQDLNTGAIPAPIYLAGQRTVEATLGARALEMSLRAALVGIVLLMIFMMLIYRMLGVLASLALCIYALLFVALLKLPLFFVSSNYIVLTLAGLAGIILSIGMAVDANVLIFERMKEELRKGKLLATAADTGFRRAWPSIRDGNVSTLITCAILFTIGTSIVRGFAVTLALGIVLSMFSAVVVTRWMVLKVASTRLAENMKLFMR